MASKSQEAYIMLWKYQELYKQKYKREVTVNKFRDKMAMQDVIDSVGFERGMDLIEYYFKTSKSGHPLLFFLYNFDKLDTMYKEQLKDKEKRRKLMEATKLLVEGGE